MHARRVTVPSRPIAAVRWSRGDPRHYQIAVLGALLAYGTASRLFHVPPSHALAVCSAALLAQWLATRAARLSSFDPRSALISALSICLLLRTTEAWVGALASAVAVWSKFVVRWRGKHVFNPSALGIAAAILLTGRAWIAPSQWGAGPVIAFAVASLGIMVVHRAARSDVAVAFLVAYAAVVFARSAWLLEPWAIPVHRLQSGALVLFAFFMISDPKTIPNSRTGRLLFATAVAVGAGIVGFGLHRPGGPIWALVALAPLSPWLDRRFPATRYVWNRPSVGVPVPALRTLRDGRIP